MGGFLAMYWNTGFPTESKKTQEEYPSNDHKLLTFTYTYFYLLQRNTQAKTHNHLHLLLSASKEYPSKKPSYADEAPRPTALDEHGTISFLLQIHAKSLGGKPWELPLRTANSKPDSKINFKTQKEYLRKKASG